MDFMEFLDKVKAEKGQTYVTSVAVMVTMFSFAARLQAIESHLSYGNDDQIEAALEALEGMHQELFVHVKSLGSFLAVELLKIQPEELAEKLNQAFQCTTIEAPQDFGLANMEIKGNA